MRLRKQRLDKSTGKLATSDKENDKETPNWNQRTMKGPTSQTKEEEKEMSGERKGADGEATKSLSEVEDD